MDDEKIVVPDPATADTQEEQDITPPADSGHGEDDTLPQPQEDKNKEAEELAARREAGKLKKVQEELAAQKEQAKAIQKWMLANPERAKAALVEIDGYSEEQATQYLDAIKQKNPALWNNAQPANQQPTQPVDIERLVESKLREQEFSREQSKAITEFFEVVPEMNPVNIKNDEERESKAELAGRVEYLAQSLLQTNPAIKTLRDGYVTAYQILSGKNIEAEAEAAGELKGLAKANADHASTFSGGTGKSVNATSAEGQLTQKEREIAKAAGMTAEEYLKYKD